MATEADDIVHGVLLMISGIQSTDGVELLAEKNMKLQCFVDDYEKFRVDSAIMSKLCTCCVMARQTAFVHLVCIAIVVYSSTNCSFR